MGEFQWIARKMAGLFGSQVKQFSIDDAFEEDTEESIRVYGSTTDRSPLKPKNRNFAAGDSVTVNVENPNKDPAVASYPRLKLSDDVSTCI